MARQWKTIQDVPVKAWFRTISQKSDIRQIKGINLQYVPMGMVAHPPGEAVEIAGTFWRVEELIHVYEFSFDLETWYPCEGDIPDLGDVDKLGAYVERELKRCREATAESAAAMEKAIQTFQALNEQQDKLAAQCRGIREDLAKINQGPKAEAKPEPEGKASTTAAKGATPPK